jgi:SagB-type dehydrogenase family enzyme
MVAPGAGTPQLTRVVEDVDGPDGVPVLFYWITRFASQDLLEYVYPFGDGSSACFSGLGDRFLSGNIRAEFRQTYVLNRAALLRSRCDFCSLELASSDAAVECRSWASAAIASQFTMPVRPEDIAARLPALDADDVLHFSEMLLRAGFLEQPGAVAQPTSTLWDFHDLLFHRRSSVPRAGEAFGRVYPPRDPGVPPSTSVDSGPRIELEPPDLEALKQTDLPFTWVVENRRSALSRGDLALTLTQISQFLFRTAHYQEFPHRALPGAGLRNELEFYLVVHHSVGLQPGFYHYDAAGHNLYQIHASESVVQQILLRARNTWSNGLSYPHVVIIIAARFARMASRYSAIAYRNVLLDAGIALHGMYLVATALHLAPCALGINIPGLFQEATGLDPFDETSIALLALTTE